MGRSYRNEKGFGPKRKRSPGGKYNFRREERQRVRHGEERLLDEIVEKFKNDLEIEDQESYENFRSTYENKKNGKTT